MLFRSLAIVANDWWPLPAGFALAWVLRMLGLDPDPALQKKPEAGMQGPRDSA